MNILQGIGRYFGNYLILLDITMHTIVGGDPEETISSHIGRLKVENGGTIPKGRIVARALDPICNLFQKDHFIQALEPDQGKDGLWDRKELTEAEVKQAQKTL
jgi:hypothetical protein